MSQTSCLVRFFAAALAASIALTPDAAAATLRPAALQSWETYVRETESRIARNLARKSGFLHLDAGTPQQRQRILTQVDAGKVYAEKMETKDASGKKLSAEDGMIHHWYGAILIPKATLKEVIAFVQNYDGHADYFADVEKSKLIARSGDDFHIYLRLVRKKVVTVRYNTEHEVAYRWQSPARVSSRSVASRIAEVSDAGSAREREKSAANDSGFLWRLNSYWRFEETAKGVIVECESISLSRSIPFGVGWLIGNMVESVPRESLDDMLTSIRDGVKRGPHRT
jgi:hypothetical protein